MADKKKKTKAQSQTEKWAKKKKSPTTSKDMWGDGLAKGAAKKIEEHRKKRQAILEGI